MRRYPIHIALFAITFLLGVATVYKYYDLWTLQSCNGRDQANLIDGRAAQVPPLSFPLDKRDIQDSVTHENEEPSLRVEYVMTVPTPEGLQARFLLSNVKTEQAVLLSLDKNVLTIPCMLREHSSSKRSVSERVSSAHCEIDKTWLDPLDPRSDESYVALGVPVKSLSDQLELTFDYFDGARPDRHRITVNVDKQDYATLYK